MTKCEECRFTDVGNCGKVATLPHIECGTEGIMTNTVDEFVESLVAATVNKEVQWSAGSDELHAVLEEVYGNSDKLYLFLDEEAGAKVVLATYQYYEGEVEADEFIRDGASILLVDSDDFEILNEITDEDVEQPALFESLIEAIETTK